MSRLSNDFVVIHPIVDSNVTSSFRTIHLASPRYCIEESVFPTANLGLGVQYQDGVKNVSLYPSDFNLTE